MAAGIIGGLVAAFASLGQAQAKLSYGHGEQFGYQVGAPPCSTCCMSPAAQTSCFQEVHA